MSDRQKVANDLVNNHSRTPPSRIPRDRQELAEWLAISLRGGNWADVDAATGYGPPVPEKSESELLREEVAGLRAEMAAQRKTKTEPTNEFTPLREEADRLRDEFGRFINAEPSDD
jgi:hypothetical protein